MTIITIDISKRSTIYMCKSILKSRKGPIIKHALHHIITIPQILQNYSIDILVSGADGCFAGAEFSFYFY